MNKLKTKLVSFLLALVFCSYAYAEHETQADKDKYDLKWQSMPVVCSTYKNVQQYIEDYDFYVDHIGIGRTNAKAEGEPVYTVALYKNAKMQTLAVLMVPGVEDEVCMIYRTFNRVEYTLDGELKYEEHK